MAISAPYTVEKLTQHFGAIIKNINLSDVNISEEIVQSLKTELTKHRLLVFRNQGKVTQKIS